MIRKNNILFLKACFAGAVFLLRTADSAHAGDGFHFFASAMDLSHSALNAWHDVDVSTRVPSGATGVLLELHNAAVRSTFYHAVRKKGSTDNRYTTFRLIPSGHRYATCGLNGDRQFQSWIASDSCRIFLLGYADDRVVLFDNAVDKSPGVTGAWSDIDVRANGVPEDATGVIVEVNGSNGARVRAKGSSDNRPGVANAFTTVFCALNENGLFEGRTDHVNTRFYLLGYTKSPVFFPVDPVLINTTGTALSTWSTVGVNAALPGLANGAIVEIHNTANITLRKGALRQAGSTDDRSAYSSMNNSGYTAGALALNTDKELQVFRNAQDVQFYLLGYTTSSDPSIPLPIGAVRDGSGSDLDAWYPLTFLQANWDASADPETGIGRYYYAIGTTPGGTETVGWIHNGLNTQVTAGGLNLTVGTTYYISVKAQNTRGMETPVKISDGITVAADPINPGTVGQVRDGTGTDEATTFHRTQLSANWNAAADAESGIRNYLFAIGTFPGGTDVAGWMNAGMNTSATVTGLTLHIGSLYYFTVKAVNTQGMESQSLQSNGIQVDLDPTGPVAVSEVRDGNSTDSDTSYTATELRANWNATVESESRVAGYQVAAGTSPGSSDVLDWKDNGPSTRAVLPGLALTRGNTYYVSVRAENLSGIFGPAESSDGIFIHPLGPREAVAAGGSTAELQAAVNAVHAMGGGTVRIPEGDFSVTGPILLYPDITVMGAGIGKTVLRFDDNAWFSSVDGGDSHIRISGASMFGYQIIWFRSVTEFRIDHCHFTATRNASYMLELNNRYGFPSTRGVVDHCTFSDSAYTGTYSIHCGPKRWPEEDRSIAVLGTADAVFVEDCYFDEIDNHPVGAFNGANYVVRHCTSVRSGPWDGHGAGYEMLLGDNTQYRGTRCYEFYDNVFIEPPEAGLDERWSGLGLRGGGGVVYNNTFVYFRYAVRFTMDTGSYEYSNGVYPCRDQIHDMWLWNNHLINCGAYTLFDANNAAYYIQENRDFFLRAPTPEQDGFTYTPFPYPHYLVTGDPAYANSVRISTRIYLEGAYSNGTQTCNLNLAGLIPIQSPYTDGRRLAAVPPNVVDWVEVELRTDPAGPGVRFQSALLRRDGQVVDADGNTDTLTFDVPDGWYHIVVRHRNHLPVMSAGPVHLHE
jgi:hypothetical protein